MSHQMTSAVLACFYQGGAHRMLAFAVADACPDASGERMFRSVPTLAHMAMISHRSVQRGLASFVAAGWLELAGDRDGGRGRSTVYRISPAWITDVAVEQARARVAGELPKAVWPRVPGAPADVPAGAVTGVVTGVFGGADVKGDNLAPFTPGESVDKAVDNPIKGDNLSPFAKPERVTNGDLKGDKFDVKGDIAVSPEHYEQNTTNTPLPPETGGECDFKKLETEFPRQDVAARSSAYRVWRTLAPDEARFRAMLVRLQADKASPQWQADAGRWVPSLGKWLRGWRVGDGPPVPEVPAPAPPLPPERVLSPEALAANKARAKTARDDLRRMQAHDSLRRAQTALGQKVASITAAKPIVGGSAA